MKTGQTMFVNELLSQQNTELTVQGKKYDVQRLRKGSTTQPRPEFYQRVLNMDIGYKSNSGTAVSIQISLSTLLHLTSRTFQTIHANRNIKKNRHKQL